MRELDGQTRVNAWIYRFGPTRHSHPPNSVQAVRRMRFWTGAKTESSSLLLFLSLSLLQFSPLLDREEACTIISELHRDQASSMASRLHLLVVTFLSPRKIEEAIKEEKNPQRFINWRREEEGGQRRRRFQILNVFFYSSFETGKEEEGLDREEACTISLI